MALKFTKSKKQLLTLVVSTPTAVRSQKRKSKDNPNKDKGKKKKGESSFASTLERKVLYFAKDKAQERYNSEFSLSLTLTILSLA